MFNSTTNNPTVLKIAVTAIFTAALAFSPLALAQESSKEKAEKEVTGEVVDMMCYVDHGAKGEKHAACAAKCIRGGGPAGITSEGKT